LNPKIEEIKLIPSYGRTEIIAKWSNKRNHSVLVEEPAQAEEFANALILLSQVIRRDPFVYAEKINGG
jgi:hypothetical protein